MERDATRLGAMALYCLAAGTLAAPLPAVAAAGEAAASAAPSPTQPAAAEPQRIEVRADAAAATAHNAIGAMVVVSRDELLRNGDTRLADALRRVPGVTVVGSSGRGVEIRMAGLGGGYTQVLLNGEPVPPGFALETLSPELIERVEISRTASVEQSNQAIAGSVNIVLRRTARAAQRELKLGLGSQLGRASTSADAQFGDRDGDLSWSIGVGLSSDKQVWPMALSQATTDATGTPTEAFTTDKIEYDRTERLTLTPRASWNLSPRQVLATDHLLRAFQSKGGALDRRDSTLGPTPAFRRNDLLLDLHGFQLRSRLNWTLNQDDGTKWELKLGLTQQRRSSDADMDGFDFGDTWVRDEHVDSLATDRGWSLAGRLRTPWRDSHTLTLGWDSEENRRNEDRVQREQPLPGGLPVENLDETYDARVRRLALYLQEEWQVSEHLIATLGLRWEGLHTRSTGNVFDGVSSRSSVVSPVLQALWKVPGTPDQLRLDLARSYKAPNPRELMPRRYVANNNSPTTPNLQGNAELKPELAWGLNAGWEHPLGKAGQATLAAYVKRIDNVVLEDVFLQDGAWVQRRANHGVAWVRGLELEAKLDLAKLLADVPTVPAVQLHGNLAFNRSRVAAVPGPDNRLAQQTPMSLNLGADHRIDAWKLSWGGNFSLQAAGPQHVAAQRWADKSASRVLDLYAAWKPAKGTQWRLSLNNLLHRDEVNQRRLVDDAGNDYRLVETLRTGTGVRLSFETSL